jgi:selenocysteine lyase/cysteine desulfurase
MLTDEQLAQLRARFPILRKKTYLYNCSQGALSDAAENGMRAYMESWRTASAPWNDWVEVCEAMRVEFARFINASPDEIAILTSASAGINGIASALNFAERPKVVLGEYEFPTMGQIWLAQQPRGAQIEFVDGADNSIHFEAYERAIDSRTGIVPLTQVSFLNGFRTDIASITKLAHGKGALVFVDGYQDCGTRPVDVKAMDIDLYITGTLKYLLGPSGLAFLYVKRSLIEELTPTQTSWMAQKDIFAFNTKRLDMASEARRFDGGSPPVPNVYMARAALELLRSIGLDNVSAQIAYLTREFLKGTRALGIVSKTPDMSVGPLVVLQATDPAGLVEKLNERGILVSARRDGVRFSFHVYNNLADVNHALTVLEENLPMLARS